MNQKVIDIIKNALCQVKIDLEGKFKYILIELKYDEEKDENIYYFIRGFKKYGYHAQNFEDFCKEMNGALQWEQFNYNLEEGTIQANLNGQQFNFQCVGGGRIENSISEQSLSIYGYSWLYGQCNHVKSLEIILQQFNYKNTSTSNGGY